VTAGGYALAAGGALAVLFCTWAVWAYNRLVRHSNLVREAWSGIDVQLKRRNDLIPAMVEAVRAYCSHERALLEEVTRARSAALEAAKVREHQDRQNALSGALRSLLVAVEAYPELKADRSFAGLQGQLVEVEDQLQLARRYYNGTVRDYNIRVESFPANLLARTTGFGLAEFFQLASAVERAVPGVEAQG
jgi:LemA protein